MPDRFRVLITDRAWPDCDVEQEILSPIGAEVVEAPDGNESLRPRNSRPFALNRN